MSKLQKVLTTTNLSMLHSHFDDPIKLFSNLYPAKCLDTLAKPSCALKPNFCTLQELCGIFLMSVAKESRFQIEGETVIYDRPLSRN